MRTLTSLALAALFLPVLASADTANVAPRGTAYANGPLWPPGNWDIKMLIDQNRGTVFHGDVTLAPGFAYSVDLGKNYEITELHIYPRQDGCCPDRLSNIRVSINKDDGTGKIGSEVWGINKFTDGSNAGSGPGTIVIIDPPTPQTGRWIQIQSLANPVPSYSLQMTELEVMATVSPLEVDRALGAKATANGPVYTGQNASFLVDGDLGNIVHGVETNALGFGYQINLGASITFSNIVVVARQDGCCPERLSNYRVAIHKDNNGQMGDPVWTADLHTDLSNPGSGPGSQDVLTASLDPNGQFQGQWIEIVSLDNPVPSYAVQIAEVQAYGIPAAGTKLLIGQDPQDALVALGSTNTFSVQANVINGDPKLIGYQWQQNQKDIQGATNASYTTPAITSATATNKYRAVVSYPGVPSVTSKEAGLSVDYALGAQAFSNRPLYAGWPIAWLVDGNLSQVFHGNTAIDPGFAYQVNLHAPVAMDLIEIYPRQDTCCPERLTNFRVSIANDNNGAMGTEVWHADMFTDGSNPGSGAGLVVKITKDLDPTGTFAGQWIQILALDNPVPDYSLQMTELAVFGSLLQTQAKILLNTDLADGVGAPGRTATFHVAASVLNGDPTLLTYQWKTNGTAIAGANAATYTTPILVDSDKGTKFSCVISYPGAPSLETRQATLNFDYNYARGGTPYVNARLYAGWPISWLVDGDRNTVLHGDTGLPTGFAYWVDMHDVVTIDHINIYPRQDTCCPERLTNFRVSVHTDDHGAIGTNVWSADLFTDGTHPASDPGTVVTLQSNLDPTGQFKGQWVRIESLDDPVPDYSLQMTELEVIGTIQPRPILSVARGGTGVTLNWNAGTLESTDAIGGTWSTVTPATSPYPVQLTGSKKFYRVKN